MKNVSKKYCIPQKKRLEMGLFLLFFAVGFGAIFGSMFYFMLIDFGLDDIIVRIKKDPGILFTHLLWLVPLLSAMTFLLKRDFVFFAIENQGITYIEDLLIIKRKRGLFAFLFPFIYLSPRFLTTRPYSQIVDFEITDYGISLFKKNPNIAYKKLTLKLKNTEVIFLNLTFFTPKEADEIEQILKEKIL